MPHSIDDAQREILAHISDVPEISRFYGIIIRMLANVHAPPHFHARYGDLEASVSIRDGMVAGQFPARARRLVLEIRTRAFGFAAFDPRFRELRGDAHCERLLSRIRRR